MTPRFIIGVFVAITAAVVAVVMFECDDPAPHPCRSINYPSDPCK